MLTLSCLKVTHLDTQSIRYVHRNLYRQISRRREKEIGRNIVLNLCKRATLELSDKCRTSRIRRDILVTSLRLQPLAVLSLCLDQLRKARGDVPCGSTVYELHDLLDLRSIVRHLKHDHILVGVAAKVRLAGRRQMEQDFARYLLNEHALFLGVPDPYVSHHLGSRHNEGLVFLAGPRWAVPRWRDAGRTDGLFAV